MGSRPLALALQKVLAAQGDPPLYLAGGAVRELLTGRPVKDWDFTLPHGALAFARRLATELGGTLVALDPGHDVARVVRRQTVLDFAAFRENAATIEADLQLRDFTINALAIRLNPPGDKLNWPLAAPPADLLDPTGGRGDLAAGLIRATSPACFAADPLRLLRAHRFQATLGFALEPATAALLSRDGRALEGIAAERIKTELDLILAAPHGQAALTAMAANGILARVLPELTAGAGVIQPGSHHLDVADHCRETLAQLAAVLTKPVSFFPQFAEELSDYLAAADHPDRALTLRWAALLHDLGKPVVAGRRGARITFYNHDQVGAVMVGQVARRLRFSRERTGLLQKLVALHMWPFHLNNARRRTGLTVRASLRLVRAAGDDLPALFLLAMADSLAGRGPGKPPGLEEELAGLYAELMVVVRERISPVRDNPPLLNGHDLQRLCGLEPGPHFKAILAQLEQDRMEGLVVSREDALARVRTWIAAGNKIN